jgi:3-oxoacyl-[acyl-carrier protein] reductase
MDLGIQGKRALLLAASGGLGMASALALAREGVHVAVCSSDLKRSTDAAKSISNETNQPAHGLLCDLSAPENIDRVVDEARQLLDGNIDILLLNHGGPPLRTAESVSEQDLADQINPMIMSQIRAVHAVLPAMKENKWGRILMVGASAVAQPIPNNVISTMLRTGMAQFCKALAGDVIKDGVTVNVVSPAAVLTDRTRSTAANTAQKKGVTVSEELANREAGLPAGRFGKPSEYGALVAYLSSDHAGYCTGGNWRVDGGSVKAL